MKHLLFRFRHICAGYDTPEDFVKALKDWAQSETFSAVAVPISGKIITHLFADGAKSWRGADRKGSKGRLIAEALRRELSGLVGYTYREQVRENAECIQQIPLTIAEHMTSLAAEGYASGKRESEIMQDLFTVYPAISTTAAAVLIRF